MVIEELTERELAVLQEMAQGKSNKEIAETLVPGRGHGQELCERDHQQAPGQRPHPGGDHRPQAGAWRRWSRERGACFVFRFFDGPPL